MPALTSWQDVIRCGGLAALKSQRIQDILHTLKAQQGHLALDFLIEMPMPAARAFLAAFPGVGPKTSACVLLFACGHPAFPVDTHVHRVTTRLGLLPKGCTAARAHTVLEPLIPPAGCIVPISTSSSMGGPHVGLGSQTVSTAACRRYVLIRSNLRGRASLTSVARARECTRQPSVRRWQTYNSNT